MKLPHRRQFLHLAGGAAALPVVLRTAFAQAYPTRPVRMVAPFAAGFRARRSGNKPATDNLESFS